MLGVPESLSRWACDLLEKYGFRQGRDLLITIHPGSGGKRNAGRYIIIWP